MFARSPLSTRRAAPVGAALTVLSLGLTLGVRRAAAQSIPPYTDCAGVAGNLVANCGFDSTFTVDAQGRGTPDGFTLTGPSGGLNPVYAHSGRLDFAFTVRTATSTTLAQVLSTTVGATYQIGFWAQNAAGSNTNNNLAVTFGLDVLTSQPITTPDYGFGTYTFYTYRSVATASNTSLAFTAFNNGNPGLTLLDDLSVTLVGGPTTTAPEPASLALLGAGLLGMGTVLRRRRTPRD